MSGTIRTTRLSADTWSPCFCCQASGQGRWRATYVVDPPTGAPSATVGLSACETHLERTQYVLTYYADDEAKIRRLLADAPAGDATQ